MEDKKEKSTKSNKPLFIILALLGFIMLAGSIFLGTYYLFTDKTSSSYEGQIKDIVDTINSINNSVGSLNKDNNGTIDTENLRKQLPEKINSLSKTKDKLQTIAPTDKYKNDQQSLLDGLDKNILIYRQMDAFYGNPEGKDIAKAGENLKKYYDDCKKSYTLISAKFMNISLPKETINLIDVTVRYINEMVGEQKKKEVTLNQNLEFISSIDDIISKFINIKQDYSTIVSKQREKDGNLDSIVVSANKNRDELSYLKQQFSNLSVPKDALNSYDQFDKCFEVYEDYLQTIIYEINNEKLLGANKTPEKIQELYKESTSKYEEVSMSYDKFLKLYSQFKDLNLQ